MECPNCGYKNGWDAKELKNVDGNEGYFYTLPIKVSKDNTYGIIDESQVYGCPKCGILFHSKY